jgi:hypothetical protein
MQARVTTRRASVGSTMRASGTFSTRTSPAPYMTGARMGSTFPSRAMCVRSLLKHAEAGLGVACRRPHSSDQEGDMQITRSSIDTKQGPSDWFTGAVYITRSRPRLPMPCRQLHFRPAPHRVFCTRTGRRIRAQGVGYAQRRPGRGDRRRPRLSSPERSTGTAPGDRLRTSLADVDDAGAPPTSTTSPTRSAGGRGRRYRRRDDLLPA